MKKSRTILSVILFISVVLVVPIQAGAQSDTAIRLVLSFDIQGDVEGFLEALKPIIARLNEIQPESAITVFQAEFAGSDVGNILVVVNHPSMAYMEKMRPTMASDEELAKLMPTLQKFGAMLESRGLYLNRAPEQDKDVDSPILVLYEVDTHGNNDAYVEGSKKLHERYYKVITDGAVYISEAMFTGESAGMIYIGVGYPSLADIEKREEKTSNDAELTRLFEERDKIGATIVSRSILRDVTP